MSANNNGVITGGGFYGRDEPSAGRCRYGNNAFGHNPECDCRVRPPQVVPYARPDCPASVCDLDDHDVCWADYERQENEYKYRHVK